MRVEDKERKIMEIREYRVVKANDLIQKTRYSLSTQEQKIVLYLITKIKPDDEEIKLYDFKIKEFCTICGIDETSGKNYSSLKNALKRLADKSMWIVLPDGRETLLRWIERPFFDKQNGTVQIKIDELMKPYLIHLQERFTQYSLYYTLAMKSHYSIRLYELLKSYEYKKTWTFPIEELKTRISAEKYERYPDFKRYVLDTAVRELNNFSDIAVTYEIIKEGRRYANISFTIKTKKDLDERLETWARIDGVISPNKETLLKKVTGKTVKNDTEAEQMKL